LHQCSLWLSHGIVSSALFDFNIHPLPVQARDGNPSLGNEMKTNHRRIVVNDLIQKGYVYFLTETMGRNFHKEFRPKLTPKERLQLGVFGGSTTLWAGAASMTSGKLNVGGL
jgi:hypothetical protein